MYVLGKDHFPMKLLRGGARTRKQLLRFGEATMLYPSAVYWSREINDKIKPWIDPEMEAPFYDFWLRLTRFCDIMKLDRPISSIPFGSCLVTNGIDAFYIYIKAKYRVAKRQNLLSKGHAVRFLLRRFFSRRPHRSLRGQTLFLSEIPQIRFDDGIRQPKP
jgi:hypothetical protein